MSWRVVCRARGSFVVINGNSPCGPPATEIDEALIRTLVEAFYDRVRQDPELGSIFEGAVRDWDNHLVKMCDFWSAILLGTQRFRGAPVAAHARLPQLETRHFVQWLQVFGEVAHEVCPGPFASAFVAKAQTIAETLMVSIEGHRRAFTAIGRDPFDVC